MNSMRQWGAAAAIAMLVFAAGCQTRTFKDASSKVDEMELKVREHDTSNDTQYVKRSSKWYVPKVTGRNKSLPDWCFSPQQLGVFVSTDLEVIMKKLIRHLPVNVIYGDGVDRKKEISVPNNRDVCDGLDKISLASGYSYEVDESRIYLNAFKDKVIDVAFMPGVDKYFIGKEKTQSSNQQQGAGETNTVTVTSDSITKSSAYKGITAELDPWGSLLSVLSQMKSSTGFIGPNRVASNVLLRDTPRRVDAMERYINELNRSVNKVIALEFQTIEVTYDDANENGINFQNIMAEINGGLGELNYGTKFASNIFAETQSPLLDIAFTKPTDGDSQSMLVQALQKHGRVSVTRNQRVITLNNQVVRLKEVMNDTYLAQTKKDSTANVGATDELIPGSVQSGIDMYAIAREFNGNIQFHLSTSISNLMKIGEVSSGDSKIQTPQVGEREFDTKALIPPNKALMITGLSTVRGETAYQGTLDDQSPVGQMSDLLGYMRSGKTSRTETITLVTASVVYKES